MHTVMLASDTSDMVAAVVTGFGAILTAIIGLLTLIRSGKDRRDRQADRSVQQKTAEKIEEEKRKIAEETRGMLLKDIRDELARTKVELQEAKKELDEAYEKADRLREVLAEKNDQIDAQDRTIRRLTRRSEVLEEWVEGNATRFEQLGIGPLPEDFLLDRRHSNREPEKDPL